MKPRIDIIILLVLLLLIGLFFMVNLLTGDVKIGAAEVIEILFGGKVDNNSWSYIIESRLNRSIVALAAGGALSVSGLILQVFFRNPLAGPGVLGITSGASLGVAVVLLGGVGVGSWLGTLGVFSAGIIGALLVLFLLIIVSRFIANQVTLLVAGLMFGYFTAAIVNILYLWANESETRTFVIWGLGSFEGLSTTYSWLLLSFVLTISILALFLSKALNALVLGADYAASMGINLVRTKVAIILITGILAAAVTVFCGPISFIGIAVPQLMRHVIRSKNHAFIIPVTFLGGSLLALLADIIVRSSSNSLPLNTVTALVGAPVIIWLIIKMNRSNAGF